MGELPSKDEFRIKEVCSFTDTQPYVLRFWESEFPQLAPQKGGSGQRVYSREDIELILRIKQLLYEEEYTIAGARERLEEERTRGHRRSIESTPADAAVAPVADSADEVATVGPGPEHGPLFRSTADTVERERYENAVREVQHLRLEQKRLQEELDARTSRIRELERESLDQHDRAARAAERLEGLLERLTR